MTMFCWVEKEEIYSDNFWGELDSVLDTETFQSLTRVSVGYIFRDRELEWYYSTKFERSDFSSLLPRLCKKGCLAWS